MTERRFLECRPGRSGAGEECVRDRGGGLRVSNIDPAQWLVAPAPSRPSSFWAKERRAVKPSPNVPGQRSPAGRGTWSSVGIVYRVDGAGRTSSAAIHVMAVSPSRYRRSYDTGRPDLT